MIRFAFPALLATAIIVFSIDASISQVADFLIQQTTSFFGISLFVFFFGVLLTVSYLLLRLVRNVASEINTNYVLLRIAYVLSVAAQLTLIGLLIVILAQIILFTEYYTVLLILATIIGYVSASAVMLISSAILVGWYRFNRDSYVVLIFGVAFAISVYIYLFLAFTDTPVLADKDSVISPDSEVIYASDSFLPGSIDSIFRDTYDYLGASVFLLYVAGSAIMLHHYASKIGRAKFWTLLLLPMIYYMITLVDTLGIYIPESDSDFFNYYLYASTTGVIGGALLGFAFWTISKSMKANKSVAKYLQLCALGFIFHNIAEIGGIAAASYPPFGFTSFSMLSLSSYMIILGLYSTGISISQDVRLRQYIKDLSKKDSGFLSTIGQAQMEKQVQSKALDLEKAVKEQRIELEKKSGIQSSIQEQDIKQYLLEVLQEVDRHKSSK